MSSYSYKVYREMQFWQREMMKKPTAMNRLAKAVQVRINKFIPEKVHNAITATIKQMIRGVLFGAGITGSSPAKQQTIEITEAIVTERIDKYKTTASIEGGITGAGGILLGLADFPILIAIKIKMLFEIASQYGFDTRDYKERLYILHIFQLAFCSHEHRNKVFEQMKDWNIKSASLPEDINSFDWRNFQQEYRDYIDLAKLAQLIPVIGAAVGLVVNYRLLKKLGITAMNAYRMRLAEEKHLP